MFLSPDYECENLIHYSHLKGIKRSFMVARIREQNELNDAFMSDRSQFVAVYGRRRVGKTFLIKETFEGRFSFGI